MLGEQLEDLKGKIIGQRVLDVEPPTMETTVSSKGSIKETQVTEMLTFVARPTTSEGVLHGVGQGVIMAGESEHATFTGEAVGRISSSSGSISWRGSIFYSTSSNGKLSFLNNMIVLFEAEIDPEGNFSHKAWEWK